MLKKSITYTDLNGDEVTEEFFFHLSKANLVEMEVSHKGGLQNYLQRIISSEDGAAIIQEFKKLILNSYGVKSPDGRRFIKTKELTDEFASTEAYSTLFLELCTDADAAAQFVAGIIPQGLDTDVAQLSIVPEGHPSDTAAQPQPVTRQEAVELATETTGRNVFETQDPMTPSKLLTRQELVEMDADDLRSGLAEGRYRLS